MLRFKVIYGPQWVGSLPVPMLLELQMGRSLVIGGKVYRVCPGCKSVVQLNKPFLGSVHLCS
jgi:hypothetical protein